MNKWHVAVIAIGAALAAFGLYVGKSDSIMPLCYIIISGVMGNATTFGHNRPHIEIGSTNQKKEG
jgi:hypothetical protein